MIRRPTIRDQRIHKELSDVEKLLAVYAYSYRMGREKARVVLLKKFAEVFQSKG